MSFTMNLITSAISCTLSFTSLKRVIFLFHSISVVFDNRGFSKGFGFVRFSEETEQQKALIEMQHCAGIGRKMIRVSLATPKK